MTTTAPPTPDCLLPIPSPPRLPPTERDFQIYEAVHIAGLSTYAQAAKHNISQTRVRQIVRRVVEWLAQVLPPQAEISKEQETNLAREIAADRFRYQLEEATELWNDTRETKYASLRIRLTAAQARLGVVGTRLDGLIADAIEGLPVPTWTTPPNETARDDEAPPEPSVGWAVPATPASPLNPTPSSFSIHPSSFPPPPPSGDCSQLGADEHHDQSIPTSFDIETPILPSPCVTTTTRGPTTEPPHNPPSHHLLTAPNPLPVTQLHLTPNHPGVNLAPPSTPYSPLPIPSTTLSAP